MITKNEAKKLWRQSRTFQELGELTATWLEGRLPYNPLYAGPTGDPETDPLIEALAYFNRHGLLTVQSQPGRPLDDEGCAQRAFVDGYAAEGVAKQIASLGLYTELLVLVYPPDTVWGYQIPVTVDEYQPFTWVGPNWGLDDEISGFDTAAVGAMREILAAASAWKVSIIDPQWGRDVYLWEQVLKALTDPPDKPFSVDRRGLADDFVF